MNLARKAFLLLLMTALYSVIIVFVFHERFGTGTITGGIASSIILV